MPIIISFSRTTIGHIWANDFLVSDDTRKTGNPFVWTLDTSGVGVMSTPTLSSVGYLLQPLTVTIPSADYVVYLSLKATIFGNSNYLGITRYADTSNYYENVTALGSGAVKIRKTVATINTELATIALTYSNNTYTVLVGKIVGTALSAWGHNGSTQATVSTTDSALSAKGSGGFELGTSGSANTITLDYLGLCLGTTIVVNGLLDGQKVKLLRSNSVKLTSSASVGGLITMDLTTDLTKFQPYNSMYVTDTDGSTIIYTYNPPGGFIAGGDVFTAQVSSSVLKNPPVIEPMTIARPSLSFYTKRRLYN